MPTTNDLIASLPSASEAISNMRFTIDMEHAKENREQYRRLLEYINKEQDDARYLEKQLESNSKDLKSITFPSYWKFGFISFLIFFKIVF